MGNSLRNLLFGYTPAAVPTRRKGNATRLSYAALASALRAAKPFHQTSAGQQSAALFVWKDTALNIADVLGKGNTKFNRKRFLLAAGLL